MEPEREARVCGHATRDGSPCAKPPLGGGGGRCERHAGLPPTEAQRDASRRTRATHGMYAVGFRDAREQALYDRLVSGELARDDLRREALAAFAVHTMRVTAFEAERGEPVPQTSVAFARLFRALGPEAPGAAPAQEVDVADLVRRVREVVTSDPGLLLPFLPPPVAEKVRQALVEGGVLPGP